MSDPDNEVVRRAKDGTLLFFCPGCRELHAIWTERQPGDEPDLPVWTWNGSLDAPTFTPDIVVEAIPPRGRVPARARCHSVVTDGHISFAEDCDHELRGQTVELPPDPIRQL